MDITLCTNKSCPLRPKCKRGLEGNSQWQSCANFEPEGDECSSFIPLHNYVVECERVESEKFTYDSWDSELLEILADDGWEVVSINEVPVIHICSVCGGPILKTDEFAYKNKNEQICLSCFSSQK